MASSTMIGGGNNKAMNDKDHSLLHNWLTHDTVDFHRFDDDVERREVQQDLLDWYRANRRKLPWRGDPSPWTGSTAKFAEKEKASKRVRSSKQTKLTSFIVAKDNGDQDILQKEETKKVYPITPYGIWVSEIMLQQTRVEAVVEKWCQWMDSFPDMATLARATPEEVNSHWAGLGFYRRARLLHDAANTVVDKYNGIIPDTVQELMELPGIGRYTASAIASVAFHTINTPVVDGNVCRVLSRMRGISEHIKAPTFKDKHAWGIAESLVYNCDSPGDLNQAMMELGATYCAPSGSGVDVNDPCFGRYWSVKLKSEVADHRRKGGTLEELEALIPTTTTHCLLCTADGTKNSLRLLWDACESPENVNGDDGGHAGFPLAPPENKKREEVLAVAVLRSGDYWFLTQRPPKGLLGGQWEFPNQCVWQSEGKASKTNVPTVSGAKRRAALNEYLPSIITAEYKWERRLDGPIEHVFSHVRHTMWIDCGVVSDAITELDMSNARWMCDADMKQVGLTSGVKKIMAAVQRPTATKKRKNST